MVSYHLEPSDPSHPERYFDCFQSADVREPERLARCMRSYVWSPCTFAGGYRAQKRFLAAQWCVLDFDDGSMTVDEALSLWCDSAHVIGTTKSHRKPKNGITCDRFRVAVRFAHPITDLRVYRYTMTMVMAKYPCDTSCKDGARYFFPCAQILSVGDEDGYCEDVRHDVPEFFERVNVDKCREMAKAGIIPRKVKNALQRKIKEGYRNTTVYGISKDLAMVGWSLERIKDIVLRSGCVDIPGQEIIKAIENGFRDGTGEVNE